MGHFIDLTGKVFGRLNVIERAPNKGKQVMWLCRCGCDEKALCVVRSSHLRNSLITSCGCYQREQTSDSHLKHGKSKTRLYSCWLNMKQRCYNPNNDDYHTHGGRGIVVCQEWKGENGAENFIAWSIKNGYRDDLTLDRIDNNGNYCPDNCRWANAVTQANNRRTNRLVTFCGKSQTLKQWATQYGIPYCTLQMRLARGWDIEKSLLTPIDTTKRRKIK